MKTTTEKLADALRLLPGDVDMVEHNPDEGQSFFCCGKPTNLNMGKLDHARGCWFVAMQDALAEYDAEQQATP